MGARVLDLACGRGRHARHLARYGLQVYGLDLSVDSIHEAKRFVQPNLSFAVHDMRAPFPVGDLAVVFNLFTSFGYFQTIEENIQVLQNIHDSLAPEGRIVLDYFNIQYVRKHLIPEEERQENKIRFHIRRYEQAVKVVKEITIHDPRQRQPIHYQESVQSIDYQTFEHILSCTSFTLDTAWGDYDGNPFDPETSPRLVLFARKS